MPLSPDDLAELRGIIGSKSPPTDDDLNDDYDRLLSVDAVALEILTTRLADATSMPEEYRLEGDMSVKQGQSLEWLKAEVERLRSKTGSLAPVPLAGGQTWSDRDAQWADADLIAPRFTQEGVDPPYANGDRRAGW